MLELSNALTLGLFGIALVAPVVGGAVYLWRVGSRIVAAAQRPPPGVSMVRATSVLRGPAARRRGHLFKGLALALAAAALGLVLALVRLVALLHKPAS